MVKIPDDVLDIIKKIIPIIEKNKDTELEYEQPRLEIPLYEDWSKIPEEEEKKIKIEIQL